MKPSELSKRMKMYEKMNSYQFSCVHEKPVIARIDGRCFSSFTKSFDQPFDEEFSEAMIHTTKKLLNETCARFGYTQSDEISLVFFADSENQDIWFSGKQQKMASQLAALATLYFYKFGMDKFPYKIRDKEPSFDCRVFVVPSPAEACNYLIWREKDAVKNSISSYARHFFSTKKLMGVNSSSKIKMLEDIGEDWNEIKKEFRNGTFIVRKETDLPFDDKDLEKLPEKHHARTQKDFKVIRHDIVSLDIPKMIDIQNREEVVFHGKEPTFKK